MPEFTWVTDPPIVEKTADEFAVLVERFENLLEGWNAADDGSKEAKRWNKRVGDTRTIMGMAKDGNERNFAYMLFGEPAGLMTMAEGSGAMIVEEVFTHPGTEGAGGMLIEHAATLSEAMGHGGVLKLASYNKRSTKAYLAWDFVMTYADPTGGGGAMRLDPSQSPKWSRANGKWRLAKYAQMKAMA
jgi:hypothetical protein